MKRLIYADALIERLQPYLKEYGSESFPFDIVYEAFLYEIVHEPTIEAEPVRHGKWIIEDGHVCCSECGEISKEYNYCPNCGARMDEE